MQDREGMFFRGHTFDVIHDDVVCTRILGLSLLLTACASAPVAVPPTESKNDGGTTTVATPEADAAATCTPRATGPFTMPFEGKRSVYFALPTGTSCDTGPKRLLANLHGVCNPPGYACGYWTGAASERGLLVCPEGNSTCGAGGPPTWDEGFDAMDRDLEHAVESVGEIYKSERRGAVLTGFSRGAYAAPIIAMRHPGRWPYLVLVEADVPLDAATLRRAGVRAVALLAGEWGTQANGERATAQRLRAQGFPAEFVVMHKAAHYYSADIDALMGDAIDWVIRQGEVAPD